MCSLVQADNGSQAAVFFICFRKLKFLEFGNLLIAMWLITPKISSQVICTLTFSLQNGSINVHLYLLLPKYWF